MMPRHMTGTAPRTMEYLINRHEDIIPGADLYIRHFLTRSEFVYTGGENESYGASEPILMSVPATLICHRK